MSNSDELTAASLELIAHVENELREFERPVDHHLAVSVAALFARSASLLRSIDLIRRDQGSAGGAGVLVRAVFEADLLLLYVTLGGLPAFKKAMGDFRRHIEIMHDRNPGAKFSDEEFEWAYESDRLQLEQVARDVGPMLARSGDVSGEDATGIYDSLYRATSTFEAHGIGVTAVHIDATDQNVWRVLVSPGNNGMSATTCLHLGAFYTAWVGPHAFSYLNFNPALMVEFTQRLTAAFEAVLPSEEG